MRTYNHYFATVAFGLGLYCGYYLIKNDTIENNTVQTCFTPGENCTSFITNAIDNGKSEIYVQAFSFTSIPISQALERAANRGVNVKVLLDRSNKDRTIDAVEIIKNNPYIQLKIDALPGIAHNKIIIVDDVVITGSFNFTVAAQNRNAENVIKITNDNIAKRYKENWHSRNQKSFELGHISSKQKHTFGKNKKHNPMHHFFGRKKPNKQDEQPQACKQEKSTHTLNNMEKFAKQAQNFAKSVQKNTHQPFYAQPRKPHHSQRQ